MTFDEYQKQASKTAIYPDKGKNIYYPALGLGEVGEIQNKVKKIMRDYGNKITEKMKEDLIDEAGDVLWYLSAFAEELGTSLYDIAQRNISKLESRYQRGVIKGSGDDR